MYVMAGELMSRRAQVMAWPSSIHAYWSGCRSPYRIARRTSSTLCVLHDRTGYDTPHVMYSCDGDVVASDRYHVMWGGMGWDGMRRDLMC